MTRLEFMCLADSCGLEYRPETDGSTKIILQKATNDDVHLIMDNIIQVLHYLGIDDVQTGGVTIVLAGRKQDDINSLDEDDEDDEDDWLDDDDVMDWLDEDDDEDWLDEDDEDGDEVEISASTALGLIKEAHAARQDAIRRHNARIEELEQEHPVAAAVCQALAWEESSHELKAYLGRMSGLRLLQGENPAEVRAEMDAMWMSYLITSGWRDGYRDATELAEYKAEPSRVQELLEKIMDTHSLQLMKNQL